MKKFKRYQPTLDDLVRMAHGAGLHVNLKLVPNENQSNAAPLQGEEGKQLCNVQAVEAWLGAKAHCDRAKKSRRRRPAAS